MCWVVAAIAAAGGCMDEGFDLSVCPSSFSVSLHQPVTLEADITKAADSQVINMVVEEVPSQLGVVLNGNQGTHHRTITVTCGSAGDFGFRVKAGEPMSFLSNDFGVSVHCVAQAGTYPDYGSCYGDYHY
ncbi:MAG TPA: hypothetical protein VKE22_07810 [Haliangiales bacterium]|nr:hypothetical protein [Haliangiales bacterium]